ncbi:MAG TPA: type VI secretion system tip protein TssI/VgrG [Polyangiaceae bacterium]
MPTPSRPVTVDTSLGANVLLFRRMVAMEELGRLFEYELELLSENTAIDLTSIIGKPMTVNVEAKGGNTAHFNGIVTRFMQAPSSTSRYAFYRATLRPSLWLLTRKAGCRIFQNKTAPQVIEEVLSPYGFPTDTQKLSRKYPTREYCVQYRETDFAFVSRLMEEEGIYYFFQHAPGKHTLVLVDAPTVHAKAKGYDELPYKPQLEGRPDDTDCITSWQVSEQLEPGVVSLSDFDFTRPKASLLVKKQSSNPLAKSTYSIFDYPGRYTTTADGEALANIRVEELYALQEVAQADGTVRGVRAGDLFSLAQHPRTDQNRSYLVVSVAFEARMDEYESTTGASGGAVIRSSFRAIDSRRQYRSARTTPQPVVRGPQTAMVVGASGKEIDTEEHGRVKLRFHWDPRTEEDEKSSCWVRVSQQWAGAAWGAIDIPRIGQEVVVSFLEGDPDRPLVTGRVYNGVNHPPYALPGNMTQSGVKTRSTPNGNDTNFNELRFEDNKGSEQVFLQAEKDFTINVKNDETRTVGHDRKKTVKNDETTAINGNRIETVDKDETITIHGKRTETVDKDENITISGGRTESVAKDESITISGGRTESVAKDENITISGGRTESVTKDENITISGARTESVGKDESVSISGGRSVTVSKDDTLNIQGARTETISKDASLTISGKQTVKVTGDETLDVTGKVALSSQQQVEIKVGAASIVLKASGEIVLKGTQLTVQGATVALNASATLQLKGAQIMGG